jgi:cyclopropane-fatty-acyl-phospholipid synthase
MPSDAAEKTLALLDDLLRGYPRDFAVRLWDGTVREPDPGLPARFTLVLGHPGALRALLWPPGHLTMAEAYVYGDVDVEGDIHAVFDFGDHLLGRRLGLRERLAFLRRLRALPAERHDRGGRGPARLKGPRRSRRRDRDAISYHYDLSNEFFALYLDRRMVYTCAYFGSPEDDLDTAQERKLDILCRKLRLRPGERLLDIGCGWGGLVMHAAKRYGVEALGVTLSSQQAELAQERIRGAGLEDRCRVELRDYRDVEGTFDKVVSVCMFEAVEREMLPDFFARVRALVEPGGVFLNQGVASNHAHPTTMGRSSFMARYVFPDGNLVPIAGALRAAESAGFEVRDVESLREHYVLTLGHWVARLERNREAAVRATDETTYRIWRLYMAGARHRMALGHLNVYQALFANADRGRSGLPLTRDDLYAPERERARDLLGV